jgi:hypothetical protein
MPFPDPITFRTSPAAGAAPAAGTPVRTAAALQLLQAGLLGGILVWEGQHAGLAPWLSWTAFLILPPAALFALGFLLLPETDVAAATNRRSLALPPRWAAAALIGLSPFFVWWLRMPGQSYFTVCAHLAMLAAGWSLFSCAGWLHGLFAARNRPVLAFVSWLVQFLFYFGFTLIVLAVPLFYALRQLLAKHWGQDFQTVPASVMEAWSRLPGTFLHTAMAAPCAGLAVLLFLAQFMPARPAPAPESPNPQPLPPEENEAP